METRQLHKAQFSILYALRHAESARYSELMRPTKLESDVFKFHIRKLAQLQLVQKMADGTYQLTALGKETANNIDRVAKTIQKQPKLSALLVVTRRNSLGQTEYLMQQRLRNPFYQYWGFLSGPIRWGTSAEETARHELQKQTGLEAQFSVRGFYRQRDFADDTNQLLEDKLFTVLCAENPTGELNNSWPGGLNKWLTASHLQTLPHLFDTTINTISMIESKQTYMMQDLQHASEDY